MTTSLISSDIDYGEIALDPAKFAHHILGHKIWSTQAQILRSVATYPRTAVKACHASGKFLDIDTPIPTPDGFKPMRDVSVGDYVFSEDGKIVPVISLSEIKEKDSYKLVFSDGSEIIASDDHLWSVIDIRHSQKTWSSGNKNRHNPVSFKDWRDAWDYSKTYETKDLLNIGLKLNGQNRWKIPSARAIESSVEWSLPISPYTLGVWLGDGDSRRLTITSGDEDFQHWIDTLPVKKVSQWRTAKSLDLSDHPYADNPAKYLGGKRIPISALRASYENRIAILRGLMDADGWNAGGSLVYIGQKSHELAEDIVSLVRTLGLVPRTSTKNFSLHGKECFPSHLVSFSPDFNPFLLKRKAEKWQPRGRKSSKFTQRTIVSIEPVGKRLVKCIGVDSPRHLYLAGDALIPTHNTWSASELTLWWIATHEEGIVITTAPSRRQVKDVIWAEIHKAVRGSKLKFPKPLQVELRINENRRAIGFATDDGTKFQGYHGDILIIMDEATGIEPEIWDAIDGIRAGGQVHLLALANPTIASGPFFEIYHKKTPGWNRFTISAFDTPNLKDVSLQKLITMNEEELNDNPYPFLTTRNWVHERYYEWGESDPRWASRVLGQFPSNDPYALIHLDWIEKGRLLDFDPRPNERVVAGIDVAGPGEDETVLVLREGDRLIGIHPFGDPDPRGPVTRILNEYRSRLESVRVDNIGIGYNFALHLSDLNFPVVPVNVQMVPSSEENRSRFLNLKSQMYWTLRERLQRGGFIGDLDTETESQLLSIRYNNDSKGKIVIESKDQMQKRGVSSPDRAEAFALCYGDVEDAWEPLVSR